MNRHAAFEYVRLHFDALVAKLPQDSPGALMVPLNGLCKPSDREQFVDFFESRASNFLGGPRRYREALESIDLCIAAHRQYVLEE